MAHSVPLHLKYAHHSEFFFCWLFRFIKLGEAVHIVIRIKTFFRHEIKSFTFELLTRCAFISRLLLISCWSIKLIYFSILLGIAFIFYFFFFTFLIFARMLSRYMTNLLHDKMRVISSKIMENNRDFINELEIQTTVLMTRSTVFISDVTMISYSDVFICIFFSQLWQLSAFLKFSSSSSNMVC